MSKSNRPEWKDTRLEYCVDYHYSLFIRNRCVFFYAEGSRFKRAVNFAAKFCKPNNICVVYVYGQARGGMKVLREYVSKQPKNIIVLCFSDITVDDLDAIGKYREWKKSSIGSGKILPSGELADWYKEERDKVYDAVKAGILSRESGIYLRHLKDDEMFCAYSDARKRIAEIQRHPAECAANCIVASKLSPLEEGLTEAIRTVYPYGVESDTEDESYVKMASINRYIRSAREGNVEMDIVFEDSERQLSIFDRFTEGASRIVSLIREYCAGRIERDGRFYVAEIWQLIEAPPYGAYDCNWYMYLFARGMSEYFEEPYHFILRYIAVPSKDVNFVSILREKEGCVFVVTEQQKDFAEALTELFGGSKTIYITDALTDARTWCEDNVQTPLAWIDERFLDLLDFDCDKWTKRDSVTSYSWVTENLSELKRNINSIDADFDVYMIENGADAARIKLFRRYYYVEKGAVGWLHSKEDFEERVTAYMNIDHVCRECGRPIEKYEDYVVEELKHDGSPTRYKHDKLIFTKKDVVGLNKKLLGRYQYEFFCIPCLCAVLDTTSEELYRKKEQFREQGCQLF